MDGKITSADTAAVTQVGVRTMGSDLAGVTAGETTPAAETITLSATTARSSVPQTEKEALRAIQKKSSPKYLWLWLGPLLALIFGAGIYFIFFL